MDRPTTRETETPTPGGIGDRTQTIVARDSRQDPAAIAATQVARTPPSECEPSAPALPVDDPDRYSLVGEHARGGLGRILRAVDNRLGRTVAVKELLKKGDSAEALFVREALITARLQHPGIVPVMEAGRWPNGEPYYVMKLVEGRSLKELITERTTLEGRLGLLPSVIAVAEAIGYAHSQDVIHRDVKPANVVVGEFGETVVVDWGLARDGRPGGAPEVKVEQLRASATSSDTVSGRVIGTPQYMAPEQARGEIVDARADVYALGVLLYEVLAGRAPHAGSDVQTILDAVVSGPPPPLAQVQPGIHADLLAIVAKAMARAPSDRYANGKELAEDLKRFQTGQLVTAQQYSTMQLVRRWISRHRGPVAVAAIASLILLVGAIGMIRRIIDERNFAQSESQKADAARRTAEDGANLLRRVQAESSVRKDPTAVVAWLKQLVITPDAAGEAAALLDEALALGVARDVFREEDWVYDVAFSPDGHLLSTASKDGKVRLYDLTASPPTVRVLGEQPGGVHKTVFTPDGGTLITVGDAGAVAEWPVAGGPSRSLGSIDGTWPSVDLIGNTLVVRCEEGSMAMWSVPDGAELMRLGRDRHFAEALIGVPSPVDPSRWLIAFAGGTLRLLQRGGGETDLGKLAHPARNLAFAADGATAAAYDGETLTRIDLATGAMHPIGPLSGILKFLTWSPDGKTIAAGGDMNDVYLFPATGGAPRILTGHTDAVYTAHWSRDSKRLLTASDDTTARLWDLDTGGVEVLHGHDDDVIDASFSPDETMVATASLDGSARLWKVGDRGVRVLASRDSIAFVHHTDDHTAISVASPLEISRWNLDTGERTELLAPANDIYRDVMVTMSPAGDIALPAESRNDVTLIRADGRQLTLTGHTAPVVGVGFAGGALYTASHDGTLRRWDLDTGVGTVIARESAFEALIAAPTHDRLVTFSDGHLATRGLDGVVTHELHQSFTMSGVNKIMPEFSPDGRHVVLQYGDSHTIVWTPDTDTMVGLESFGHFCEDFAFSPDGATIAGGSADRTIRIWSLDSGALLHTYKGHNDLVMRIAFSPDGTLLASASYDRTVRIWNLATGQSRVLRGHINAVDAVEWLDNGKRLLTSSRDGTIRIWPTPSTVTPTPEELRRSIDSATNAVVHPGDRVATPIGDDTQPT